MKKHTYFDGYLGLECDENLNVKPVAHKHLLVTQHRIYVLETKDVKQNTSTSKILEYISNNYIYLSKLNGGQKKSVDEDGQVLYKNGRNINNI